MPLRNLIVEVGTAIAFAIIYAQPLFAEPLRLILGSFHVAVLILVTVIDLEHRLILNKVIFPSIIVAALTSFFWFGPGWYLAFVGGAIGFTFFWLAAWLGRLILRRNALGAGDVKLAAYIGIISILLLLVRVVNLRSGIPYGPFLVIGGFMTVLWGTSIMNGFFFR